MEIAKIGIIGGSGLYQMPELEDVEEIQIDTPFGSPSDALIVGTLENERVAFLPRHGRGHLFAPTEVPFRANIYAMKMLGVERILSASAVGSLKEEYAPLDMVIPDQFFDRTRARAHESTFFGEGIVAHVTFAHPVCDQLGNVLENACKVTDVKTHRRATYVCMEGPAFSTKAESEVYRSLGMGVIGMTNLQEAKLAREAEICYATLALVTDYDCWHPGHDAVTADSVIEYLNKNVRNAQLIMKAAVSSLSNQERDCKCGSALKNAIFTAPHLWPEATRKKLDAIVGKYALS
jgi:5'-methylthioadenosine phosphorylase